MLVNIYHSQIQISVKTEIKFLTVLQLFRIAAFCSFYIYCAIRVWICRSGCVVVSLVLNTTEFCISRRLWLQGISVLLYRWRWILVFWLQRLSVIFTPSYSTFFVSLFQSFYIYVSLPPPSVLCYSQKGLLPCSNDVARFLCNYFSIGLYLSVPHNGEVSCVSYRVWAI